jgi:dolichol-phosphate mannosyltransferase
VEQHDLERLYEGRFPNHARAAKVAVWEVLVREFFQRWVAPSDVVLDIGCGFGEFLNHVVCARRIGVDGNPASAASLRPGTEFHAGSATDLSFLEDASVNFVFTSNLMEHLDSKHEVERMLREARRVLVPEGHIVMMGPNLRVLPGAYWDFWDHLVPITDRSLHEVLQMLDFEVVNSVAKFLPYTTRSSLPQAPFLVSLYLRVPIAWRLLGGQFLLRARKPNRAQRGQSGTPSFVPR